MGAATVDALVVAGWNVVAVDRSADDPALDYALSTKADLEEVAGRHGASVRAVVGDVRSASDMQAAVDEAVPLIEALVQKIRSVAQVAA